MHLLACFFTGRLVGTSWHAQRHVDNHKLVAHSRRFRRLKAGSLVRRPFLSILAVIKERVASATTRHLHPGEIEAGRVTCRPAWVHPTLVGGLVVGFFGSRQADKIAVDRLIRHESALGGEAEAILREIDPNNPLLR